MIIRSFFRVLYDVIRSFFRVLTLRDLHKLWYNVHQYE